MRTDILRALLVAVLIACAGVAHAAPLVGPGAGNVDALQAEGNRLYNRRNYAAAAEKFLQATRVDPAALSSYLSLARSRQNAKQIAQACYAYRVYVRAAPEGAERSKAQNELELCERRLKANRREAEETAKHFVDAKAGFFASLEARHFLGEDGAGPRLEKLVKEGYLGPDLAEMAAQLHAATLAAAEAIHEGALRHERLGVEALLAGVELYDVAAKFGPEPAGIVARRAFLEGVAELEKAHGSVVSASTRGANLGYGRATVLFSEAVRADPATTEYHFFRAMAQYRGGNRKAAVDSLRRDLPADPRTKVLGAIEAFSTSPQEGAAEVERVLFGTRYPEK